VSELPLIRLTGVNKRYLMGSSEVYALRDIDLSIERGEFVAIMGPSGSGKTTLMNIIGLLDHPDEGRFELAGRDVSDADDDERSDLRNRTIGFIFQNFNLLPRATALRNVRMPFTYRRGAFGDPDQAAHDALARVGLEGRSHHYPNQLSGGERQRVAIARALTGEPALLLADEPTGNLDRATGEEVMSILRELSRSGRTVAMVTHDPYLASTADRIVSMLDGRIVSA